MRWRKTRTRRPVPIGQQVGQMHRDFPTFRYSRKNNIPTWFGQFQPTETAAVYTIKIVYQFAGHRSRPPKVWVVSPTIRGDAPHRYADDSLCLHFPRDASWTPAEYISKTIVPWSALWLLFYEVWLDTDCWYGPEAPHTATECKVA